VHLKIAILESNNEKKRIYWLWVRVLAGNECDWRRGTIHGKRLLQLQFLWETDYSEFDYRGTISL
jgi:hypothetical protein